ncbi:MAG: amidohydrolase family protein [Proteobacteria bacterium]|nr:amidohydrolase family protein [Pseudomonadota bacterium]
MAESHPLGLPPRACDCHTHVFLDERAYPFDPGRHYTPPPAAIEALAAWHDAQGIARVVVVQPSVYGLDHRATLQALRVLGPARARGVAVIDPDAPEDELDALARAGVRGLRVNLIFGGDAGNGAAAQADAALRRTAARAARRGWHLQVYAPLPLLAACIETLRALPVPVVLDHHAGAQAAPGERQDGLAAVLDLVAGGRAWVKLSAPYRASALPGHADLEALARRFVQAHPGRVLWGSDWPHPRPGAAPRATDLSAPHAVDVAAVLRTLQRWLPDPALQRRLFTDNPAALYGFDD